MPPPCCFEAPLQSRPTGPPIGEPARRPRAIPGHWLAQAVIKSASRRVFQTSASWPPSLRHSRAGMRHEAQPQRVDMSTSRLVDMSIHQIAALGLGDPSHPPWPTCESGTHQLPQHTQHTQLAARSTVNFERYCGEASLGSCMPSAWYRKCRGDGLGGETGKRGLPQVGRGYQRGVRLSPVLVPRNP